MRITLLVIAITDMDFLGAALLVGAVYFALAEQQAGTLSKPLAALAITFALKIQGIFMWIIRSYNQMEIQMVAVERVNEYIAHAQEPLPRSRPSGQGDVPDSWPSAGKITFEDVKLRYERFVAPKDSGGSDVDETRAPLPPPLVLGSSERALSFEVAAGERVGVVGRTGAGKSSLTNAIFRLQDPCAGRILIDDIDLRTVSQERLRQRLGIVTQDPVLFSDTLRRNLDPSARLTDDQLWHALRKVKMSDKVASLTGKLEHVVADAAENFSLGERQVGDTASHASQIMSACYGCDDLSPRRGARGTARTTTRPPSH